MTFLTEALGGIYGRISAYSRRQEDAVEVDAELVGEVVAARHSVRIEHGYELEDELASQEHGAPVLLAQQEVEEAVEDVRARRLARMQAVRENVDAL